MQAKTLNLSAPIVRGANAISQINLIKPNVAAMRGVSLNALLNMNVDAIVELIPRISEPTLVAMEVAQMDCVDILQAGIVIASFFLPETGLELMS